MAPNSKIKPNCGFEQRSQRSITAVGLMDVRKRAWIKISASQKPALEL